MGTQFGTRVCFSMRWSPLLACLQAKESISSFSACYWIDCFRTCSEEDSVQEQVQVSFPLVIGAVIIGVVSGKAIFGPPLDEYWKKKLEEEAAAKETDTSST